jgi:hypothetical protein
LFAIRQSLIFCQLIQLHTSAAEDDEKEGSAQQGGQHPNGHLLGQQGTGDGVSRQKEQGPGQE